LNCLWELARWHENDFFYDCLSKLQKQFNKLNPSTFFIEVPAPCQKSERSCTVLYMCIRGINFAYVSLIFLSYFRTVRTVWYILFFLFCYIKHLCFFNPTVKVLAKHTAWQHTYDNFLCDAVIFASSTFLVMCLYKGVSPPTKFPPYVIHFVE
jgi:hypothetical protein